MGCEQLLSFAGLHFLALVFRNVDARNDRKFLHVSYFFLRSAERDRLKSKVPSCEEMTTFF